VTPDDALDTGLGDLDDLFDNGGDVTSADATTSDNALDNLLGDADIALDSTVENNADELLTDLDLDNLELDEPETNLSDVDLSLELGSNLNDVSSTASELLNEELDEPETNLSDVDLSLELGSDLNDASSTESELLNEPPVSTFDFDLLDIEDDGIVTGFVNEDEKPESLEKPIETDTIDNLEIFEPSSDEPGLESLDSLLSELPEEIDEFSASTATTDSSNEFGELEALLESPDNLPEPSSESPSTTDLDDEFGDLEALLQDTDKTLAPAAASGTSTYRPRPTSNRLSARRMVTDQTMRVSVSHLDNLSNLVGELVVNRNTLEQDQDRLRQFLDNLLFQVQQLNDVGQRMRDLYERSLLESSLISSRQSYHMTSASFSVENSDIEDHATGESFDALEMDRFTGFHTLSQEMIELIVRVRESASDIAYTVESSDQVTRQFRQVTNQLQEGLNKARMVPFAQTASRLPRAVRDISLKCGKEARLVVEGRDILIDKMILEQLYDPMTHLVNNAITHGIETPEERHQAGKSSEGLITVRAFYQGNQTVISVGDDGAGIDPDIVKQKALQKGLISQSDAHTMTVLDVYDLLFHPGFSTRDQADDFAGRGFGMDVVRTSLADIRGNITIDSEPGHGTNFTIRLPLTLSISKALSCISNQARIAFPMDGVEDMFDVSRERIQKNDQGEDCILWRDTLLPFQNLSDLLSFNRTLGRGRVYGGNQDENMISIVVLRSANSFIALEVDQVMGEQEIVIKQLEGPVPKPTGIAGATVLGDGRVMPIADVLELIDLAMGRVRREPNAALWAQSEDTPPEEPAKVKSEPTVLIVDDSITVRELLSMSFNKVGYRVEQARDGQEAWEKLRSGLPCDLVFCDIEMPRMDGLELLSRLQKDDGLQQIPIAMLTSRGADRHRQMAVDLGASGYFTKPYLEEALLDAANKMLHGEKLV
ncbi:hybrid sensor histidine kinase/response regulator, partial [Adonisia turfae]